MKAEVYTDVNMSNAGIDGIVGNTGIVGNAGNESTKVQTLGCF